MGFPALFWPEPTALKLFSTYSESNVLLSNPQKDQNNPPKPMKTGGFFFLPTRAVFLSGPERPPVIFLTFYVMSFRNFAAY